MIDFYYDKAYMIMELEQRTSITTDRKEAEKYLMVFRKGNTDYIIYYMQEEVQGWDA